MTQNKYKYNLVIQQNYGQGWEDNSFYECDSNGKPKEKTEYFKLTKYGTKIFMSLFAYDLGEYQKTRYSTRHIFRKELNEINK
jgi:hypothetical protein